MPYVFYVHSLNLIWIQRASWVVRKDPKKKEEENEVNKKKDRFFIYVHTCTNRQILFTFTHSFIYKYTQIKGMQINLATKLSFYLQNQHSNRVLFHKLSPFLNKNHWLKSAKFAKIKTNTHTKISWSYFTFINKKKKREKRGKCRRKKISMKST